MRCASLIPGLLLLGLTIASPVAASNATAGNAVEAETILEAREAAVSQREAELIRKEATRELRAEIEDAANGRLEVIGGWLGALIGLFGIAVTIATLIVTFRTPAVAAQAARETAHKAVAEEKARIEALVEQTAAIAERAKVTDAELSAILDRHKAGQPVERPAERATIEAAADAARAKPAGARTVDDLRSLIVVSRNTKDWKEMRDHARALLYLHGQDRAAERIANFNLAVALDQLERHADSLAALDQLIASYADDPDNGDPLLLAKGMFNRGVTLTSLDRLDEAVSAYEEIIRRFDKSDAPMLVDQVAKALINKGSLLVTLGKLDVALAGCDEVIDRFDKSGHHLSDDVISMAMFNRAVALRKMGRHADAIAAYDDLVRRFKDSEVQELRDQVVKALISTAYIHARDKNAVGAADALRRWGTHRGAFDCEKVARETIFDSIRKEPEFAKLLAEMGCAPPAKKRPPRRKSA
jgi:tetratricopeptide (TPR) repeat protein